MLAQAGYMALYGAVLYHVHAVVKILYEDFRVCYSIGSTRRHDTACHVRNPRPPLFDFCGRLAQCCSGTKIIEQLFPAVVVLDGIWAASPLLLWEEICERAGGPAFACVALLAYVPFAQRTLIRAIYLEATKENCTR